MPVKQRDEEKRTKLWRTVVLVSTIVIVLVAAILVVTSVKGNPLQGEWVSTDEKYYLDIEDENELTLGCYINDVYTEIDLMYTIDKTDKIISLRKTTESYEKAADNTNGAVTAREIDEVLEDFAESYSYSLESGTLVLAEREYGEQMKFTKIK